MNKLLISSFVLASVVMLSQNSCYYDNEVDQYGVAVCDTTGISFSQDIMPIINANCISCHVQGGQQESSPFTSYQEIKNYSSAMMERVNGVGGIMPPS
ncbi:MAG: hypothetical protein IT261_01555, partial [Saprospiraceae bacterium]|nr:hypothetical protein [Saprospiraceae bacterium]